MCLCCVYKKICAKSLNPTSLGEFTKEVAICLVLLEKGVSPCIFQHHDTSFSASSGGVRIVWSSSHTLDVPN
jgi:hypothetical protein